jgi:hypothetical protein
MDNTNNHVFYFLFGYHCPAAWKVIQTGDVFDLDSTGILPILATNESAALEWGTSVAKWYLELLYKDHPEMDYSWRPEKYARWIERDVPNGFASTIAKLPVLTPGLLPDFATLKDAMAD